MRHVLNLELQLSRCKDDQINIRLTDFGLSTGLRKAFPWQPNLATVCGNHWATVHNHSL